MPYNYDCLMLYIEPPKNWKQWSKIISPNHLHSNGIEQEPHVSLKYGFLPEYSEMTVETLAKMLPLASQFPLLLSKMNIFYTDEYDVLHYEIENSSLRRWHGLVGRRCECIEDEYDFKPHMTIAYFKKGFAEMYLRKIAKKIIVPNKWVYSTAIGKRYQLT